MRYELHEVGKSFVIVQEGRECYDRTVACAHVFGDSFDGYEEADGGWTREKRSITPGAREFAMKIRDALNAYEDGVALCNQMAEEDRVNGDVVTPADSDAQAVQMAAE